MKKETKRKTAYQEQTTEKQIELFCYKEAKYLPAVDNIYYSVYLDNDMNGNTKLKYLFQRLDKLKEVVLSKHEPQEYDDELMLDNKTFQLYKYCLSRPDLYDIFIINYLPNNDTPRIMVQIRSYGLWVYGIDEMLRQSSLDVFHVFNEYGVYIQFCRENRIDYCYHTNNLEDSGKLLSDLKVKRQINTTMEYWQQAGRIEKTEADTILHKDYFAIGNRKSNNIYIRIYNKTLEVIQEGYKGFFFEIWHKNGLISTYDKFCMEYAYKEKNYDYIHKARLMFYIEHGLDNVIKCKYKNMVNNVNTTLKEFKQAADQYMPKVTVITNIEFETKRKFYYYSDDFINRLKCEMNINRAEELRRIYQILDNREVFLNYLTSTTLSFVKKDGKYVDWWNRLRNTKLDGNKADERLVRDYTTQLNERVIKERCINAIATAAVYNNKVESNFVEDVSDLISNLNDNSARKMSVSFDGELESGLLHEYTLKKAKKEKRIANRRKQKVVNENES